MASGFKHLYIGVTSEIEDRVLAHKTGRYPGSFTDRYNMRHLVNYERLGDIYEAIAREKQLKRWSRAKKIGLIVSVNPDWKDLSADWGKPAKRYDGPM